MVSSHADAHGHVLRALQEFEARRREARQGPPAAHHAPDGEDLYLTTARHDREREETADITARLFAGLIGSDGGARAILLALPSVFPWVRHLSDDEVRQFVLELVDATHDAVH